MEANREKIRKHKDLRSQLTEREVAILAVTTTDMLARGWRPFDEAFYIQVVPRLQLSSLWRFPSGSKLHAADLPQGRAWFCSVLAAALQAGVDALLATH